jgi:hypothetical protein
MAGRNVAFFRNLNLGQRGSPTKAQLLEAFAEAGARDVESVGVNGTVVFSSSSPVRTRDRTCSWLIRHTDWCDIAPVRTRVWVRDLVVRLEELRGPVEVSFFDSGRDFPRPLPWRPEGGRLTVVAADRRHAISVNDQERTSFGTPTLERLLGLGVTSRGAATVLRLADRLG